jgi:hypothetical protein
MAEPLLLLESRYDNATPVAWSRTVATAKWKKPLLPVVVVR